MKQTNIHQTFHNKAMSSFIKICLYISLLFTTQDLFAQITLNTTSIPGWGNNNGSGTVTFQFQNTNPYPIIITDIEGVVGTAGLTSADIWTNPNIVAPPGAISVANGWTQLATGTFTGVANTTTTTTQPFLTGLSVTIPAGANLHMAITAYSGTTGRQRYFGTAAAPVTSATTSAGGCIITMGTNISYGGGAPPTAPTNANRGWIGKITFIPAGPCTDPPIPGTPLATATSICAGQSSILSLSGGTGGTGQSYQWESSLVSGGPYTDILGATNSSLTVTPSVTTYYRSKITCGANTVPCSEIGITVAPIFPGGNYTIDASQPTGGTNFQTFAAAVAAISCGIGGPIIFDVAAGSGPYNEQISLPSTIGSTAVNTVTFNGNGETLQFASTNANARHVIKLDGADYITFDNLNISATGTYGWGIHYMNGADYNTVSLCNINTSITDITSSNHQPIVMSNSITVVTTAGNNGNYNTFIDNTFNGGYYSVTLCGNAVGTENIGNTFTNNQLRNSYSYSLYMLNQKGATINNNDFSRPLRTGSTTTAGIFITAGCLGNLIEGNRIHNFFDLMPSNASIMYSIYCAADATALQPNRVVNNLIYNINHNGTTYGCYNTGGDFEQIYHNTISLDNTASTAGITYGIYQTTAASGLDFRNNIITISRGGTGAKVGLYYNTITSAITSNNNVVFLNSLGTGAQNFGSWGATPYATQALWNTATTLDASSLQTNPTYNSPISGDYTPTAAIVNNAGANVGIVYDILGNARTLVAPDPGAFEFTVSPIDVGVFAFISPNTSGCYSNNENIQVSVKNFGSVTLDFSVTPLTVNVDVTGTITANLSATPSGTLAPGATMNVIVSPTIDMTGNGVYNFSAYTLLSGDGNSLNNALSPGVSINVGPIGGTITSNIPTICASATPTITLSGHYGGSIQWQESTVGASGPWTNVGTGATTYIPSTSVTQTSWYQAEISCNGNTAYSNVLNIVVNNPQVLSTTPGSRCGIGSVTLGATANASNTLNWYANASGGSILGTGNSFITPSISSTTNFYVSASEGGGGGPFTAPMPVLGTPFSGNVRGYWFTAPSAFTITGLNVPLTGTTQSMAVVKFVPAVGPPSFSTVTNAFTVLYLIQNSTNTGVLPVNIPIAAGEVIGILGQMGTQSAYAATTGVYNTTINGQTVACTRMGMQFPLGTTSPIDLWQEVTGAIGVVNITYTTGCEGARTAVTASINSAPIINVSATNTTLCPGGNTDISVSSSNDPNYTYSWTSTPSGFTASGPGPHNVIPSITTTYEVSAIDNTSGSFAGCANVGSVTVITAPALLPGTVSSTLGTICISGTPTLTVVGSAGGSIQWQESTSASGPWTNIGTLNSTTYIPAAPLTQTMYYQVQVCCQSTCTYSNMVTVTVNNPLILSTTPGQVCGTSGSTILSATASPSADIKWYDVATGGTSLATGSNFTTPVIASTTTYYAEPSVGGGGGTASPIQLTEMDLGTNDQLEIQNVSPDPIDVTGWKVAISDNYTNINAVNTIVQVLSGIMTPGQTKSWTDLATAPNYWGSNMFWNPGAYPSFTGWAAILDQNNVLKDFVIWNWPAANIAAAAVTIGTTTITVGSQWTGDGIDATTVAATNSLSRQGTSDNNSAADFSIIPLSINSTNPGMTLPFTGFGCVGTRVPVDAIVATCNTTLNLTCFIQGYWDGSSQMQPVLFNQGEPTTTGACDSIVVELHNDVFPYGIDATTTAVLQQNGTATCIFPPVTGNKYIAVKHRSAVQTWSAAPVAMGTTVSYNFSTAANMAFGDNQVEVSTSPSVWAFYSGDIVIDENIDLLDLGNLETEISNFSFGYISADVNGDGNVDLLDSPLLETNISNFIYSNHP